MKITHKTIIRDIICSSECLQDCFEALQVEEVNGNREGFARVGMPETCKKDKHASDIFRSHLRWSLVLLGYLEDTIGYDERVAS